MSFELTFRRTSAGWTSVVGVVGVVDVEKAEAAESGSRRCERIDRRRSCDSAPSVDAVTSIRVAGVGSVVVALATFIVPIKKSLLRRSLPLFTSASFVPIIPHFHSIAIFWV